MATPQETAKFRRMINERTEAVYTADDVTAILAAVTVGEVVNFNLAALEVWREKMAKYADLTDIAESGSERKLSQLYKQAQGQVKMYESLVAKDEGILVAQVTSIRVPGRSSAVWGGTGASDPVLNGSLGPRA